MKYYWLAPKDQRVNNWILHREHSITGVELREQYRGLRCEKCNKLDELAALELGIDDQTRIRSRSDYLITDDGFICVSNLTRHVIETNGVHGVYFRILSDDRYAIALPIELAKTNREIAGMEFYRQCLSCGRYRETCLFPTIASIETPSSTLAVICPEIKFEGTIGRKFWYLATQDIVKIFRANKISGVEYIPAY